MANPHLLVAFLALAAVGCSPGQDAARPVAEEDLQAIAEARARLKEALASDDVPGIIAELTEDHLTMAPNGPTPADNRALADWHQARIDRYAFESSSHTEDIQIYGDLAVERWSSDSRLVPREGGEDLLDTTKGAWIWKRQPEGGWKLMLSIWNSDLPARFALESAPFDGVFEYMVEGSEGLSFYQDGYFVHFRVPKGMDGAAADLTDAMVNEWWDGAILSSGTYTVVGDTVTCRFRFNRNPARVGQSFRWVGDFSGDTLTWRVLDEDGAMETVGRSLRLR